MTRTTKDFDPDEAKTRNGEQAVTPVHLYLLTYGGGLLPGDRIDVSITLRSRTRLVVTTPQGSTKIYKTNPNIGEAIKGGELVVRGSGDEPSRQILDVNIEKGAALCYLPDPTVPFKDSAYEQIQSFTVDGAVLESSGEDDSRSSLCVLDWVTEGRTARGEKWDFHLWKGKNEVWTKTSEGKRRLLLRDFVILDDGTRRKQDNCQPEAAEEEKRKETSIRDKTSPHGIVGTLILHGPIFDPVGSFFMKEFTSQPRIGGRDWSSTASPTKTKEAPSQKQKQKQDKSQNVTWTAAHVRSSFVLVKFGAQDFETAREWLGGMLKEEGTIAREFSEEALACLQ